MAKENFLKTNSPKKISDFLQMDQKDWIPVAVFLIVVLCVALGYFVFLPAASGYKAAKTDFANLSTTRQDLLNQQTSLESLKNDISQRSDFIAKTADAMPVLAQVPELIVTLSAFANDNSLYITNFSPKEVAGTAEGVNPGEPAPRLNYNTVEIDFDISGSYADLKQFIKDIESNIRPINIVSISVTGGGQISNTTASSSESLRFSIKANVYYEKQK